MNWNWKKRVVLGLTLLSVCLTGLPLKEGSDGLGAFVLSSEAQGTKVHPVVLVHGLGSTADRWYEHGTIYYTLQADGYDMNLVLPFAYPPGPGQEDSCGDVRRIAERLAQEVDRLSQTSVQAGGPAEVDVVVHSLGGLVTRQYLSQHLSDHNVGKFIDIGTPHQGSMLMVAYNDSMGGLADWLNPDEADDYNWLTREVIDLAVHAAWKHWDLSSYVPDPTTPAAQQLDPNNDFLRELNQPGLSPKNVDYSMIYGDISLGFEWDVFGIPIVSEEIVSLGDLVVGRDNASTIPGLGTRQGPNPSNYHTHSFSAPLTLRLSIGLDSPQISIPDVLDRLEQVHHVTHIALVRNSEVNQRILTILNEGFVEPPTVPPPAGRAQSVTVLLIDVSGSMGENWQGGVKIESAKAAGVDVINMIETESQIGASNHQVAIATFTDYAYLDLEMTTDYNVARQVVNGLMALNRTNIGAGLQVSNQALTSAPAGAQKIIILLSDGLTNEGLLPQEILDGPVQEAAAAGTCIYTVGFGDQGDLDEELLQSIANGAACGEYNYASAHDELEWHYITLRHQSLGEILGEFHGQVAQGEQVDAGQVNVPSGQDALYASLYWPGSVLGLVLTDPQGQAVDENYPGAVISTYPQMVYAVVEDPLAGMWNIDVFGQDVPAGTTRFDAIISSRVALVTPVPTEMPTVTPAVAVAQPSGGIGPAVVFLVVVVGAIGLLVLSATRGRLRTATTGVSGIARPRLIVRSGRLSGREFPLGAQGITIGRGRGNDVQLEGSTVSRRHAVIRSARGQFFLQDQRSTHGTYLNGRRVDGAPLSEGDIVRIGNVELEFRIR